MLLRVEQVTKSFDGFMAVQDVELTVWPEAAYPYVLDHEVRTAPKGSVALLGHLPLADRECDRPESPRRETVALDRPSPHLGTPL